jgi:hypothetical protein
MKKIKFILTFIVIFHFFASNAFSNSVDKKDSVQDEPRMLVVAFFKSMEKNDKKGMLKLITPERAKGFEDEKFFDYWLKVWKSVSVKNVGKVVPGYSRKDEGRESVKVLMLYDRNGQELKDSVTVTKIGGLWYWDEN